MSDSSFYPASKNPYQDPLSQASTGTTNIETSKIDLSDPELKQIRDEIRSNSETNWCLFGYVKTSNVLKVVSSGTGGISELIQELTHSRQVFGFLKIHLDDATAPKFVYLTWNPAGVPPLLKGQLHGRSYDVGIFLQPFHLQVDGTGDKDFDEKKILEKLRKSANK